jgi:hypothetical protein
LEKDVSQRVVEDALRRAGVRYRPARKKIHLAKKDAKQRVRVLQVWKKKPAKFWSTKVHGFIDSKGWPAPLTPAQRAKYQASKVTGHLRLASEGVDQGFTQPRKDHSFLGVPTIKICAAVAKDRVIMWHDFGKAWNGTVAAATYKGPLLAALKRTWGARRSYTIVEDGDRKGFQSNKGKEAKKAVGIQAMVLPPRTPSLMPLDASLWKRIDDLVTETAPSGTESKAAFAARLQECAKKLPRGVVKKSIAKTYENIIAILDAKGYHPKND